MDDEVSMRKVIRDASESLRAGPVELQRAAAQMPPYGDDSQWREIIPDGVPDGIRLDRLRDGTRFQDRRGIVFTKVADGPVQSACVIRDSEGYFAQWDNGTTVDPLRRADDGR